MARNNKQPSNSLQRATALTVYSHALALIKSSILFFENVMCALYLGLFLCLSMCITILQICIIILYKVRSNYRAFLIKDGVDLDLISTFRMFFVTSWRYHCIWGLPMAWSKWIQIWTDNPNLDLNWKSRFLCVFVGQGLCILKQWWFVLIVLALFWNSKTPSTESKIYIFQENRPNGEKALHNLPPGKMCGNKNFGCPRNTETLITNNIRNKTKGYKLVGFCIS